MPRGIFLFGFAILLFLLALVPGLPKLPLFLLAGIMGSGAIIMSKREPKEPRIWNHQGTTLEVSKSFVKILSVVFIILAILAIFVPVPAFVLDWALTLSLLVSLLLFFLSLGVLIFSRVGAIRFTSLILMVIQILALLINISTTRSILFLGEAGKVVESFGSLIVEGDMMRGAVTLFINALIVGAMIMIFRSYAKKIARGETKLQPLLMSVRLLTWGFVCCWVLGAADLVGGFLIGVFRKDMTFHEALTFFGRNTIGDQGVQLTILFWLSLTFLCLAVLQKRITQSGPPSPTESAHAIAPSANH